MIIVSINCVLRAIRKVAEFVVHSDVVRESLMLRVDLTNSVYSASGDQTNANLFGY